MRGKRRNAPELPDASAGTPEERRERARQDFTFFRRAYFPHYCLVGGDSRLHEWLDTELPRMADAPEGVRLAIAAPRGEAKSTFVSLFFVLWAVLTGRKHYILIIADALEQAASLLGAVKDELEFNEALKRDFPGAGKGHVWNVGTVVTPGNVKIQALGAGKRMRGLRHGPHRPDLIVLDDLENDGNVDKPEQRDKRGGREHGRGLCRYAAALRFRAGPHAPQAFVEGPDVPFHPALAGSDGSLG